MPSERNSIVPMLLGATGRGVSMYPCTRQKCTRLERLHLGGVRGCEDGRLAACFATGLTTDNLDPRARSTNDETSCVPWLLIGKAYRKGQPSQDQNQSPDAAAGSGSLAAACENSAVRHNSGMRRPSRNMVGVPSTPIFRRGRCLPGPSGGRPVLASASRNFRDRGRLESRYNDKYRR